MAEAAPFVIGTEVLANSTVLGGVGEVERSSSDPRVRSSREPSCQIHMERHKLDHWPRQAALLGLLDEELAPAPVPPGW